ncbi:class I SAM-dependent methyltransferase [Salinirussus salinus]|uniref:class I SAM-dependent methyltransferase n=1 Tax=Salinirussus salinus TaxID=1198300 RepID=UPI001356DB27|nr:class I SAM-dependent methyltransferase [Salinirussus salinus]
MVDTPRWAKAQQAEANHETHHSGFRDPHHAEAYFKEFWNSTIESIEDESVLAVGAGTGIIHTVEQPRIQVAVDPLYAISDIDLTGSRASNITGAGEALPFPEASFDTVISNNVLDHTQKPRAVLQEIANVIKDKGRFLLVVNTFDLPGFIRQNLRLIDTPHPHHFSTSEIEQLLVDSGFEITYSSSEPRFTSDSIPQLITEGKFKKAGGKLSRINLYTAVCHPNK